MPNERPPRSTLPKPTPAKGPRLALKPVTAARFSDLEALFEARGGPKSCWCMIFRASPTEARETRAAERKRMLAERVRSGTPIGLLGYVDGAPVAWCSVAPRATFRNLGEVDGDGVWSITCFFVLRAFRGQGLTAQLLEGAIAHAKKHGATRVLGYPVPPDSPSYRFMGFTPLFANAGFETLGTLGARRTVVQKRV